MVGHQVSCAGGTDVPQVSCVNVQMGGRAIKFFVRTEWEGGHQMFCVFRIGRSAINSCVLKEWLEINVNLSVCGLYSP